jgi:hypothetical protein
MKKDPRIKVLANQATVKIKALTDAHQTQIAAIYQDFREQAAQVQESNADELETPSVTPIPSPAHELKESHDFTL